MKKTSLCLLGIFISASSFAQTAAQVAPINNVQPKPVVQAGKSESQKSDKSEKDPKFKGFNMKRMTIKPDTSNKVELKTTKEYINNVKPAEKIPDDIQKRLKAVPAFTGKEKVIPPNIQNFTQEDMKNDPTLKSSGKVFFMNEKMKELSALDTYNIKREQFLRQKELNRQKIQEHIQVQNQQMLEQGKLIKQRDEVRKRLGLPISRLENTKGANGNESGLTREAMSLMNNGTQKMPAIPPTGNIQSLPGR